MDAREKFVQYSRIKGLRHTRQRDDILEVFLGTERHVTAQELYDLVRKKHPHIGYATVARTLKLLVESGVSREVNFGDGAARYEHQWQHEHHDHLICTRCGRFVEIFSPELEKLQEKLVKKHGFTQERHKLDIFGLCPKCQNKGRPQSKGATVKHHHT